jgi:hypothetical protein
MKKATKNTGRAKKSERLGWGSVKSTEVLLSRDVVQSRAVGTPVVHLNGAQQERKSDLLVP